MSYCIVCKKELNGYDIGFYKKMVNRGAQEYACIDCMCPKIGITENQAWEMIRRFQKSGCALFPQEEKK
jgi:hypothetical protein